MKMSGNVIFGTLIVLLGLSLLLHAFHIHVPLFRLALALLFLYVGARILLGVHAAPGPASSTGGADTSVVFSDAIIAPTSATQDLKYTVLFGRALIDLTRLEPGPQTSSIDVAVIFGEADVRVPRGVRVTIRSSTAFGLSQTPDGHSTVFGSSNYQSPGATPGQPALAITVNVVFGAANVIERDAATGDNSAALPSR